MDLQTMEAKQLVKYLIPSCHKHRHGIDGKSVDNKGQRSGAGLI